MRKNLFCVLTMLLVVFASYGNSPGTVKVYSLQEGLFESTIIKPRIYIGNIGNEALSNFKVRYYFSGNGRKDVILDDYSNNHSISFKENPNISVYDSLGYLIYGTPPDLTRYPDLQLEFRDPAAWINEYIRVNHLSPV